MQRLIVLAVAIGMVVLLASGIVLAQEESLPDLTVDKTGPSTATPDDLVTHSFDVTNVGSGDAVLPSGAVLVRDNLRASGHLTGFSGGSGINVGVTGVSGGSFATQGGLVAPTRFSEDTWNSESTDAIIAPGGGSTGAFVSVSPPASGGHIINCATVDPDNVIVESDESNNTDCVTTKILPKSATERGGV
jgi:hypothetical protein